MENTYRTFLQTLRSESHIENQSYVMSHERSGAADNSVIDQY